MQGACGKRVTDPKHRAIVRIIGPIVPVTIPRRLRPDNWYSPRYPASFVGVKIDGLFEQFVGNSRHFLRPNWSLFLE